jgi:hypothetical protein
MKEDFARAPESVFFYHLPRPHLPCCAHASVSVFFVSPQGAVLSHKQKSTGQSKCAMLLRCVDMRHLCVPWGCRSVALLGFIQRGPCCPAAVAQFGRSLIRSRRRSRISRAQPRAAISAQRDVILSLNIDIAMLTDELKCSLYV